MSNRIQSLSISSEGPRQTPNESFGTTLAGALAKGTAGAMGLAAPLLGAVSPMLSAPVSQAAQAIAQLANQNRAQVGAGTLSASANFATGVGTNGASAPAGSSGGSAMGAIGGSSESDPMSMLQAQAQMNNEYLMLQNQMQQQSREYEAMSNIMKVRHDTAKNAISNIH